MTIGQVIDMMRAVLDDSATTKFWSDANLTQFIGAAQNMFMAVAPEDALCDVETTALLDRTPAGTGETFGATALPSNFSRFRAARTRLTSVSTFYSAKKIPIEEMMAQERAATDSPERAIERSPICSIWANKIMVAPVPSEITGTIQLFYMIMPTAITAGTSTVTNLTVNQVHQYALADYALYLAFNKMDPTRAALHLQTFGAYVQGIGGRWPGYHDAAPVPRRVAGDQG